MAQLVVWIADLNVGKECDFGRWRVKRVEDGRLKMPVKPFLDDPCPDFF